MKRFKYLYRASDVLANSVRSLFSALASFTWSLWIINRFSADWWGECVPVLLYIQFGGALVAWGCREYYIRSVSLVPADEPVVLGKTIVARFPIWLLISVTGFLIYEPVIATGILLALSGRFFAQSLEGVIVFHRKFATALLAEIAALSAALALANFIDQPSYHHTLLYIGVYEMIRGALLLAVCRRTLRRTRFSADFSYLVVMFPFIVMGFIGVLNSSVDKIFVYVYLSPAEKSFYQVYMNFLLLVSAMPGWILFPFLKNYFRGGNALRSRIRKTLLLLAFVLIPAALGVIYFFMTRLYHFEVSARMLGFAAIYLVPSFISAPLLYRLLAEGRYYGLTAIAAAGILVTSTLCYLLVPLYGLTGAVCGGIAGQVLLAVLPLLFRDKQSAIS